MVLSNGAVYTVDARRSWAEAVAISGESIAYVGSDEGAESFIGPDTVVVDLAGKMLLPGFQDSHVHPLDAGVAQEACPLERYSDPAAYVTAVRACAERDPDTAWIRGAGWLATAFPLGSAPHKSMLDAVVPDRPVMLLSKFGHMLWVNSRALEIAGVTRDTTAPSGGQIVSDPETGTPTGLLKVGPAMDLVAQHAPPYDAAVLDAGMDFSVRYLNRLGITAWQDAAVKVEDDPHLALETYRRADREGRLTARVVASLVWETGRGLDQIPGFLAARERYTEGNVDASTVKIVLDSLIDTHTAALLEDYSDRPGFRGETLLAPELLKRAVARLDSEGLQVHVHITGDAAARIALDAFEHARGVNGPNDNRHHITHLDLLHPDDIPRFEELGVVASFQPLWANTDGFVENFMEEVYSPLLGPERMRLVYPIRSVQRSGATIAFGSDWSVTPPDPLDAIEVAVTRVNPHDASKDVFVPDERISLADAIAAYTINSAFVNHLDDRTGSIEVGKLADLIVLDRNLFEIEPSELSEAEVVLTLFGGMPVYGSLEALAPRSPEL